MEELTDIWWVDSSVALLVSAALGAKGLTSLAAAANSGIRWWSAAFWRTGSAAPGKVLPGDDADPLLSNAL